MLCLTNAEILSCSSPKTQHVHSVVLISFLCGLFGLFLIICPQKAPYFFMWRNKLCRRGPTVRCVHGLKMLVLSTFLYATIPPFPFIISCSPTSLPHIPAHGSLSNLTTHAPPSHSDTTSTCTSRHVLCHPRPYGHTQHVTMHWEWEEAQAEAPTGIGNRRT
jgi:hypothetical protein